MKKEIRIGLATLLLVCCGGDTTVDQGGGGTGAGSSGTGGTTASGTGGATTSGTGGSGGTAADCNPACTMGLECCNGLCVNKANDINNCGTCGNLCTGGGPPFCNNDSCDDPPACAGQICSDSEYCCGTVCCPMNQLCCVVNQGGPVGAPACFDPNAEGTCPPGCPQCVCASPDTPIETPRGRRAIASLKVGDLVYSIDGRAIVAVPIVQVSRTPVQDHRVVRVQLDSGEVLEISHGHPTADGRTFADLQAGDSLGSATVSEVQTVPYRHGFTHDILPASDSGTYLAGGALIGSTLKPSGSAGVCLGEAP